MKIRDKNTGRFVSNLGVECEIRDKPCPRCGRFIMRKSSYCRSCWQNSRTDVPARFIKGYFSAHQWLYRHIKKIGTCKHCGLEVKTEWANISGSFIRNPQDWLELCHRCHKNFDKLSNKILEVSYATNQ